MDVTFSKDSFEHQSSTRKPLPKSSTRQDFNNLSAYVDDIFFSQVYDSSSVDDWQYYFVIIICKTLNSQKDSLNT